METRKYDPLKNYLLDIGAAGQEEVTLSFDKLEAILGFALPQSAYNYSQWWENHEARHPQARAWLDAGWQCVYKDLVNRRLMFRMQTGTKKTENREQYNHLVIDSKHAEEEIHTEHGGDISSVLVFSPCSRSKCPERKIPLSFKPKNPKCYLERPDLVHKLIHTRQQVLNDPRAQKGTQKTLAFDLYMKAGQAYKGIRESNYEDLRERLIASDEIQWFFLSGGYGVIHALEKAVDYQATFSKKEADNSNILFTGDIWREAGLSTICEHIVQSLNSSRVYVFGGRDYVKFIERATYLKGKKWVKIMPLRRGCRSNSLSQPIRKLAEAILHNNLNEFDRTYQSQFKCL